MIGYGSPNKADSEFAHGTALGEEEAEATRRNLGWTEGPFTVPEDVYTLLRKAVGRGADHEAEWTETCKVGVCNKRLELFFM